MKHIVAILVIGAVLLAGAPGARAFHEEAGRAVGEAVDQFRGLAAQLERHLRGLPESLAPGAILPAPGPAERPLISFMLDHRDELALTPDQVGRLEALRAAFAREAIRREADIRIAEMDVAALLDRDPVDLGQVEAKVREAAQLRADFRIARLRTIEQGRAVLSPEQRTRLQSLLGGSPRPPRRADRGTRL